MGGRQSAQNTQRSHSESHDGISSVDSITHSSGLHFLVNSNAEISSSGSGGVSRRRRRRDQNDMLIETHSLPSSLFPAFMTEIKCPVCNKRIGSNEIETHLMSCLSRPRVTYNEDVLNADSGECIICFDELCEGDSIARLPCFCIYHKKCIDDWFRRNRCCPEHPDQMPPDYNSPMSSASTIEDASEGAENANAENSRTESSTTSSFASILSLEQLPSADETLEAAQPGHSNSQVPKTIVHVDDGSLHGSPTMFGEEELAQLTSKIKTIYVKENV